MRIFSLRVQYQEDLNAAKESFHDRDVIYQANDPIAALEDAITYVDHLETIFKDKQGFKIVEVVLESVEVGVVVANKFPTTKRVKIFEFSSTWERPHKFQMQANDFIRAFEAV